MISYECWSVLYTHTHSPDGQGRLRGRHLHLYASQNRVGASGVTQPTRGVTGVQVPSIVLNGGVLLDLGKGVSVV